MKRIEASTRCGWHFRILLWMGMSSRFPACPPHHRSFTAPVEVPGRIPVNWRIQGRKGYWRCQLGFPRSTGSTCWPPNPCVKPLRAWGGCCQGADARKTIWYNQGLLKIVIQHFYWQHFLIFNSQIEVPVLFYINPHPSLCLLHLVLCASSSRRCAALFNESDEASKSWAARTSHWGLHCKDENWHGGRVEVFFFCVCTHTRVFVCFIEHSLHSLCLGRVAEIRRGSCNPFYHFWPRVRELFYFRLGS